MTKIIAEIGSNHLFDFEIAKKQIIAAKKCGVDYVKFQLYDPLTDLFGQSKKEKLNSFSENHFPLKWLKPIFIFSKKQNIPLLFSVSEIKYLKKLQAFSSKIVKIASCDNSNIELILNAFRSFNCTIISLGYYDSELLNFLLKKKPKNSKVVFLYCVSKYPTKISDINLDCIGLLKNKYNNIEVGYSDHFKGTKACKEAIRRGAVFVEKHFSYLKAYSPDMPVSCNLRQLKDLVSFRNQIERNAFRALTLNKPSSLMNSPITKKIIKKNEVIKLINFFFKRPGLGMSPKKFIFWLGKKSVKTINKNCYFRQ